MGCGPQASSAGMAGMREAMMSGGAEKEKEEEEEDRVIDETGLVSQDIELVMGQAGCNRTKAVKALRDNGRISSMPLW